jgi:methyl-accepting chemotaxis protein
MSDWSISKRITVLSAVLLGGLLVAASLGAFATMKLSASFHTYAGLSQDARAITAIRKDALEARAEELHYRIDGDPADLDRFRSDIADIAAAKAEIERAPTELPEARDRLVFTADGFASYAAALETLAVIDARLGAQIDQVRTQGKELRERLTALMEQARVGRNVDLLAATAMAQQDLVLSRVYLERYFLTEAAADIERATALAGQSMATLRQLAGSQPGAVAIEATGLVQGMETMTEAMEATKTLMGERIDARTGLDATGSSLMAALDDVFQTVIAAQDVKAEDGVELARLTLILIIGLSLLGAVGAAAVAMVMARRMRAAIAVSVSEMQALAQGDLSIAVTGADKDHELGQMARALEVFRANALATKEAEARQKELERAQRARDAERDLRETEAAEAQRRLAEEERREVIRRLQASIGTVVDGAAAGDFSRRIGERFTEPEFNRMADAVNRLMSNVESGVKEVARVMSKVAAGDLTERMAGSYAGLFAELQASVNETLATLTRVVDDIAAGCEAVTKQAAQMTDQSVELARRAEQQAASLEETSAAMEEISATARSSAEGAAHANEFATRASGRVDEAGRVVTSAVSAMSDIRAASARIGEIVSVIEGIAFQTNLLALNASVEAARAGAAGKGFAVVATEVRALAQRSSTASQDIKALIDESAAQVNRGVGLVEQTGTTLKEIVDGVRRMAGSLGELVTAGQEQATGVQEVTTAIAQLDVITQKNAALADRSRDLAGELRSRAEAMEGLVATFRTGSGRQTERNAAVTGHAADIDDGWQAA